MRFEIAVLPPFLRQLKRLSKHYPSPKGEVVALSQRLEEDPMIGDAIGRSCRKIRIAIASKGSGKRGGGRVITPIHIEGRMVFLLHLYDKSEKADLEPGELDQLLQDIP